MSVRINYDSIKPIYIQVADAIEDDIVLGRLQEGEAVYSQLILARELKINPATAAKGINVLVQKGILEKQRGLSMTVAPGARKLIVKEKLDKGFAETTASLVEQAIKIGLTREQVLAAVEQSYSDYERGPQDE